jgi:flagellar biosynthesis protein FlhG
MSQEPWNGDMTRILAIASGKGGVGKTFLSLQLSGAIAATGKQVLLFDGDLGLANIHVVLGLKPLYDLSAVVAGEKALKEILLDGPGGIKILPGASGIRQMAELGSSEMARLLQGFSDITPIPDHIIIDAGAGIGDQVTSLIQLSDRLLVVVRDEAASLADGYALIKVMHQDFGFESFDIVVNDVESNERGNAIFNKLNSVANRFLGVALRHMGTIPHDSAVPETARHRTLLGLHAPKSAATRAIRDIANDIIASTVQPTGPLYLVDRLNAKRGSQ